MFQKIKNYIYKVLGLNETVSTPHDEVIRNKIADKKLKTVNEMINEPVKQKKSRTINTIESKKIKQYIESNEDYGPF